MPWICTGTSGGQWPPKEATGTQASKRSAPAVQCLVWASFSPAALRARSQRTPDVPGGHWRRASRARLGVEPDLTCVADAGLDAVERPSLEEIGDVNCMARLPDFICKSEDTGRASLRMME